MAHSDELKKAKRHLSRVRLGLKRTKELLPQLSAGERELVREQLEEIRQVAQRGAKRMKDDR